MLFNRASLVLLPMALWPLLARADSFALKPKVEVDSQGIFLDQLISSTNTDQIANIHIAPSPAWGEVRSLKKAELIQLLAKAAPKVATNEFIGSPEIKISRESRKLEDKELLKLVTEQLQPKGKSDRIGTLELRLAREWKPVPVPVKEPIQLRITSQPAAGLTAFALIQFEIVSGDEVIGTYAANLKARLLREVWVAHSAIKRGTTLDQADIALETKDVINVRESVWTGQRLESSARIVDYVPPGGIILERSIQQTPVIKRGHRLQAIASDGLLSVSIQAEALEDGAPDQVIRIRNLKTKKELKGKVIDEDTIQVTF